MTVLTKASNQWFRRPNDERYTSLIDMQDHFRDQREHSREIVVPSKHLVFEPEGSDHKGLQVIGPKGGGYSPTHFSFGQLASLAKLPANAFRDDEGSNKLPAEIVADCLNYRFQVAREEQEVGVLLYKNGTSELRAATGPKYGRIWNADIVDGLVKNFGNGVDGSWKVPGEFGKAVKVDKSNTTLYAGDRDMFVFLADEENRIEIPNRRNGESGSLARGFFVWNSEVGDKTFGLGMFLFDYACSNRMVWGAEGYTEIKLRHTASAPERFLEEIQPALQTYRNNNTVNVVQAIEDARKDRLNGKINEFLANRFGARVADKMKAVHMLEEQRPIENRWDVVTAATAYAKGAKWQDARVDIEREAGKLLTLKAE